MIEEGTPQRIVEFRGHLCPGLAVGIQVGHSVEGCTRRHDGRTLCMRCFTAALAAA